MDKKSNKGIIGCLIIIIIILVSFIILLLTGTISFNLNKDNNNINNKTNENTKNINNSIKLDDTKDYVYNAEYHTDNKYAEFMRDSNSDEVRKINDHGIEVEYNFGMQYLSKLKVPFININSSYAKVANATLEKLYLDYAKIFDKCAEEAKGTEPSCSQILTYKTYKYDNMLSVVVIDAIQATSRIVLNYHIYNFDLTTGEEIKYLDFINKQEYNNVEDKIKTLLKNKMDSLYGKVVGDLSNACYGEYDEATQENKRINCYNKAYELFTESIRKDEVLFFVDNNGKLNIFAIPYYNGAQDGDRDYYLFTLDK